MPQYDALLIVSFGGPEQPDDVMPFLENVTRGKNVPRQRLESVAEHYWQFGGQSPINEHVQTLLTALIGRLNADGPPLPVYWGNRFWHPLLREAIGEMADDGVKHALAFVTSAFGSYSGCRAYSEDIERARLEVGAAPKIDKLRLFYNHPGFVEAMAERVLAAAAELAQEPFRLVFTAHSLPLTMSASSPYERQLREACRLVAAHAGIGEWTLAYQSRSGRPSEPWLGPDVSDCIARLSGQGISQVVVAPIGFLVDHMEVIFDLDVELADRCEALGVTMARAATVGNHAKFVEMIRQLILERLDDSVPRLALGNDGPWPDVCADSCCRS